MYECRKTYNNIPFTDAVEDIYRRLYNEFGPQGWWPSETDFETIVGAILTQAVNWTNVEKAIENMKQEGVLSPEKVRAVDNNKLAVLIKPSGYYNMKAKKLKAFIHFLFKEYDGSLKLMFQERLEDLRKKLLGIYGIGPETADSILLYAGGYPVFVVDAYTKRIFYRLNYVSKNINYHDLQQLIMDNFRISVDNYNEFHALLVETGKNYCKRNNQLCKECPLA
ncbi:MAG: endonuclease III domain-containing protein [Halanaerobiaceae bacterium]